jgi:uncharacterized protein
MPKIITYSLRLDRSDSGEYYRAISVFADAWQPSAMLETADLIAGFRNYRLGRGLPDRSDGEYAFELLVIGVLLSEHSADIARMTGFTRSMLKGLVSIQKRWPPTEKAIKPLRGWTAALARILARGQSNRAGKASLPDLLDWLRANEENGQAARLAQWQDYFDSTPGVIAASAACLALAGRFIEASQAALGKYTAQVPVFLKESAPKRRWQYDAEFVSRTRPEYHLGMLGTEVLNRAYRQRFLTTSKRIVIVPPCMRFQPEQVCQAVATVFGAHCQACTPTCRIHQLTRLGEKKGFGVFIMPDELRVFNTGGKDSGPGPGQIGVVGVSCALTNWGGGWDVAEMGIPAQGLLLDYCGCSYHWDKQGIPTDINFKSIEEMIEENDESH